MSEERDQGAPERQPRPELWLAAALLALAIVIVAIGGALEDSVKLRRRGRDSSLVDALTLECRQLRQAAEGNQEMLASANEQLAAARMELEEVYGEAEVAIAMIEQGEKLIGPTSTWAPAKSHPVAPSHESKSE